MEALYSKLYDTYMKLKSKKWSELDNVNKDQEVKFMDYISAAEQVIQQLKSENERLLSRVKDLTSEVASIRSAKDEQCIEYQELLMEENRKNEELSEEVARLRNLQQVGNFSRLKDSKTDNGGVCTPASGQVPEEAGNRSQRRKTHKRRRQSLSETEDIVMPSSSLQDDEILRESEKDLHKGAVPSGSLINVQQPQCCRAIERPGMCLRFSKLRLLLFYLFIWCWGYFMCYVLFQGGDVNPTGQANCLFQVLVEYLVDLKFSTVSQTEEICISAVHQSSGYSFNLTWVNRAGVKEPELLYRVLSLGTFERVAPEWMKDAIMFSTTMCPKFFDRLSRVVKLHA
ncbi:PREDICTED: titan9 [Prunus dulcis]|uniref:PREDICTED: titan9 n=1 Tax=Prunus dulcis TaxID=3755 RepID=A0A5E4GAN9_PRUDU|nr:PREDICTED: titan9 [Prunus dulcis]